jgi:hypothetical protein
MLETTTNQIVEGGCYHPVPPSDPRAPSTKLLSRRWLALIIILLLAAPLLLVLSR